VQATLRRLQVEVTGACNLRCRMCLVRYRPRLDRHRASFPLDRFVALLDELPDLEQVTLQGLGEPLLHPDLADMIRAAKDRGLTVGFNTNGTLLTGRRIDELLDSGVDWLHVSVDGATARTFEHIRDGAHFDQVVRNLRRLVAARARRGQTHPAVQLNAVLMRSNQHELLDLVRLAADIGVDRLWLQALSHDFGDTAEDDGAYVEIRQFAAAEAVWGGDDGGRGGRVGSGDDGDGGRVGSGDDGGGVEGVGGVGSVGRNGAGEGDAQALMAAARRLAEELGLPLRLPDDGLPPELAGAGSAAEGDAARVDELPCDWPWDGAYVTYSGKVQPCCMVMGEDRVILGDLDHQGMGEIWTGPAYEGFRAELLSEHPPEVCRGCSWYRRVF